MKTKFTNRKEKSSNLIRKHAGMIGVLMMTILMTSSIVTAQRTVVGNDINAISDEQIGSMEKNPSPTQPVKTVVTIAPSIPLCPTISGFDMIDKSYNKVILGWDNSSTFDSITIRYALSGSSTYRSEKIAGSPNPGFYILQGLTPQTTYDFEISTKCFTGATSNWSAPLTITTFAEPAPRLANSNSNQRNSISLKVNPNPAHQSTTISFVAPVNSSHLVVITSSAGREIHKTTEICTVGKIQIPINLTNVAPGLYFVRVYSGTNMSVERLIVQ